MQRLYLSWRRIYFFTLRLIRGEGLMQIWRESIQPLGGHGRPLRSRASWGSQRPAGPAELDLVCILINSVPISFDFRSSFSKTNVENFAVLTNAGPCALCWLYTPGADVLRGLQAQGQATGAHRDGQDRQRAALQGPAGHPTPQNGIRAESVLLGSKLFLKAADPCPHTGLFVPRKPPTPACSSRWQLSSG